jgi:N-acetylglucosaminyl-diphospho-decaprenol L-rhamnosyltransferase
MSSTRLRTRRPVVSVCIVNWNCRGLLRRCLRSLQPRRQRLRLEIVVVDNASTDGAAEMVAEEFPQVQLLRNTENVGYARACNQAARCARGRYLFFLNNDTLIPRGALRRLVKQARQVANLGLLGPQLRDARGRVQRSVRSRPTVSALCHRVTFLRWTGLFRQAHAGFRGERESETTPPGLRPVEVMMGAAVLMPRRVWQAIGGWSEAYVFGGEDIDLCLRVARSQRAVLYDPGTAILHLGRVASRQQPAFVLGKTLVGLTRSLRVAGASPPASDWAIFGYKLAFTLDLPLRLGVLTARWLVSRLRGRQRSARRAWLDLVGLTRFIWSDLRAFWQA